MRCETTCVPLKRVLRASTIALKGPKRGTKPKAKAAGSVATAAKEATMLDTCESVCLLYWNALSASINEEVDMIFLV